MRLSPWQRAVAWSFVVLTRAPDLRAVEANTKAGCEVIFRWQAQASAPVYVFFHCPTTAFDQMQGQAAWNLETTPRAVIKKYPWGAAHQ